MLVSNRPGKGLEKAWGLFGETTKNSFVEVKKHACDESEANRNAQTIDLQVLEA